MNLESLDDSKALGEFLPFVMSRMIRDDQQTLMTPQFAKYLEGLSAAGLVDDGISKLTSVMVGFRNGRVTMSLYFADDTPELSAKVWELFRNVLIEFKQLMASA